MYTVVIADDEGMIRQGIKALINWDELNCHIAMVCKNGREAFEYIEKNEVDFVITDLKMPLMDGLELSRRTKELNRDIKVIVLTAFSEFSLAQESLRNGVADFIIKNNFIEELPQTMRNLIKQKEEASISQREKKAKEDYFREMILGMLIKGKNLAPEYEKELELLQRENGIYCICSLIVICTEKKYTWENIFMMIRNLFEAANTEYECYFVGIEEIIVVFCGGRREITKERVLKLCNQVLKMTEEFTRMLIKIGVSDLVYAQDKLPLAYEQAVAARNQAWTATNEVIGYVSELTTVNTNSKEEFQEIWNSLLEGNLRKAVQSLRATAERLSKAQYPIEKLKISAFNFVSSAYRYLYANYYDEEIEKKEQEMFLTIEQATIAYQIYDGIERVLEYVDHVLREKYHKHYIITLVDKYIAENYHKGFAIAEMARDLEVSAGYISRIYKQKTGKTIIETINRYRVEKAKIYLKDTTMKIYEVAEAVGFEDPAYFTTVFIKYAQKNPSEYRAGQKNQ